MKNGIAVAAEYDRSNYEAARFTLLTWQRQPLPVRLWAAACLRRLGTAADVAELARREAEVEVERG